MITAQSAAVPDSLGTERVDGPTGALIDAQMTLYASQGFSGTLLVVRDQRVVLLKGYGRATDTDSTRNAPDTRFEMNSMTKMFTGVSVLQLAGDGRLSLDDSVERHLGAFAVAKPEATIRHLGLHTAGLVPAGTSLASESREAFLRDVGKAPRESAAGVAYRYTNAGFSVLAAIVESVSGESFESYVRRRIFTPAGMRTALFRDEVPASDSRFARGYVAGPSHRVPGPANPYGWGTIGAGGVWCTVGDVYRWLLFVESGRAFDARFRSLLFTDPPAPAQEAFGWRYTAGSDSSRALIAKGGGSDDFASQLLYFPKERVVIVWASNDLSKRWRRTLNQAVPDLVFNGRTSARPPS
ncbi:MAG: serine hydrolase domain-containing protein [Gemmatimonadaceae bacterium]